MSETRNRSLSGILILVVVCFLLFFVFAIYVINTLGDRSEAEIILNSKSVENPIAVVEVNEVIFDSKKIIELLQIAEEQKKVKAIILRINSPGGAVGPCQEIYSEIERINKIKPVYSSMGTIAASGGYYIAAATKRIYANPGTLTGSIGVIMQFMDLSKLYQYIKVSPETIKAGRYKDAGQPGRKITQEERELFERMIAGVHRQFVKDIEKYRGKKIKGKIIDHTQGQIFSGEDAYNLGLVDKLGSLWDAGREIHKELELKGKFGLSFIVKKKKFNFSDFMQNIDESISNVKMKYNSHSLPLFMLDTKLL